MTDETVAATEKKVKAPKEPKPPRRGVGTVIREAILAGKSNEEAFKAVKGEFPDSNTTASTVSWYRNQLRKQGHDVPSARDVKAAAAPAAPEPAADPLS